MAADCVNINITGNGAPTPGGRDLPTATATVDVTAVNAAIAEALANAAPDYDSTDDIEAIAAAVAGITSSVTYSSPGHLYVMWDTDAVRNKNQVRDALRVAMNMVNSEAGISEA